MRVIEREPMLTGILKVVKLPPQSTFRRFLASLGISDRRADSSGATGHAAEGVGGDPRGTERGHAGYRHPHLKKQFRGRHLWARGYFCCSSGNVTDDVIAKYIAEQNTNVDEDFKVDG